jgi:hypothetical protein
MKSQRKYRRDGLRYASDTTDAEWAMIAPFMPPAAERGRPRTTQLRAVVNAIFYIAQTGCHLTLSLSKGADAAEGFSALHDGATLLLSVA